MDNCHEGVQEGPQGDRVIQLVVADKGDRRFEHFALIMDHILYGPLRADAVCVDSVSESSCYGRRVMGTVGVRSEVPSVDDTVGFGGGAGRPVMERVTLLDRDCLGDQFEVDADGGAVLGHGWKVAGFRKEYGERGDGFCG